MNENQSSLSLDNAGLTAEAISRRAYELWEQEGRPADRDLHHWLRAEQELRTDREDKGANAAPTALASERARPTNVDQPLQVTRPAAPAQRDVKAPGKKADKAARRGGAR